MAKLLNKVNNRELIAELEVADSFLNRMIGLLGRANLRKEQGLWIHRCNSVHTVGMKFPIDVVFVDRGLKVRAIKKGLKPNRLAGPVFGASSVFELASGCAEALEIKVGDQLYVGD